MYSKSFILFFLVAGLHVSHCTGNLLNITTAFASDILYIQNADGNISMSMMPLSCEFSPEEVSFTENKVETGGTSACANARACFDRMHQVHTARFIFDFLPQPADYPQIISERFISPDQDTELLHRAREGPFFEDAPLFAQILAKRE